MKLKKLIIYFVIVLSVFLIYKLSYVEKENYVVLGDSLAIGQNSYGELNYGYSNYLVDYLIQKDKLNNYILEFAKSEYKVSDIINDIYNNKTVTRNNRSFNIRNVLRESTLVTVSIGFNDFIQLIQKSITEKKPLDKFKVKNNIDITLRKINDLIKNIKKYAKNDILIIGYYNPYPYFESYKVDIEEIIKYSDKGLQNICEQNNVTFVKISDIFNNYVEYFPNRLDFHPNVLGYEKIYFRIRGFLD